jgi:hypothetical protein
MGYLAETSFAAAMLNTIEISAKGWKTRTFVIPGLYGVKNRESTYPQTQ